MSFWLLVVAGGWACLIIGFAAGYGIAASRDFRRDRRGGYVAGPFTGGRR